MDGMKWTPKVNMWAGADKVRGVVFNSERSFHFRFLGGVPSYVAGHTISNKPDEAYRVI